MLSLVNSNLDGLKGRGKRGHIVADTKVSPFAGVRNTNFVCGIQKMFLILFRNILCLETFCVRNKCFPVCATQETLWATMCLHLPGP